MDRARERDLETAVGIALRAAVKPNVVGRVEVGVGREGPAAFVGIDYPFQVFFPSYSIITWPDGARPLRRIQARGKQARQISAIQRKASMKESKVAWRTSAA